MTGRETFKIGGGASGLRAMKFLLLAFVLLVPVAVKAAEPLKIFAYASQRGSEVSLRQGPGYQYPVRWVYRHRGTPFGLTAQFDNWRRVVAPDGAVGWMNVAMLSSARTIIVTGKGRAQIRADADLQSKVTGLADPGAVAGLKVCTMDACRIHTDQIDGWIAKDRIWGARQDEIVK